MDRSVHTVEDLLRLLDGLFEPEADRWTPAGAAWWDGFYDERDRGVPFFAEAPEESLVAWHEDGRLPLPAGARVLDLGCGAGRNAVWLAQQGCVVDALDLSATALDWARERAAEAGVSITFAQADMFAWEMPEGGYDLVVDSGVFHHLPPHRRISHRQLLERALAPGGLLALSCFAAGAMGSEAGDADLYRAGRLSGGLAYGEDDLRRAFGWLEEVELRRMREAPEGGPVFGVPFLWVGLFRRVVPAGGAARQETLPGSST